MQGPSERSWVAMCGGTIGGSLGLRAADHPTGCCSGHRLLCKVDCYALVCAFVTTADCVCEFYMCTLKPFSESSAWTREIVKITSHTYYARQLCEVFSVCSLL